MKFFDKKQNALPMIGHLAVGRGIKKREGPPMHRRTFLLGFLGTLGAAPTLVAAVFPIEAAPLSEALSQPRPAPSSTGGGDLDMDTEKVASEWSQYRIPSRPPSLSQDLPHNSQSVSSRLSERCIPRLLAAIRTSVLLLLEHKF